METLKIYNDKITINLYDDHKEKWVEVELETIDKTPVHYLDNVIGFSDDLTVEGFLKQLKPFQQILNITFYSHLGGHDIGMYIDELDDNETVFEPYDDISHIEFHRVGEIYKGDISDYVSFHGVPIVKDDPYYSMSLAPLINYKHFNLKLNNEIVYQDFINGKMETKLAGNKHFTVFDVLSGFFTEISFFGEPENKKSVIDKIDGYKDDYFKDKDED
jgi:hypothetical protein